MRTKLASMSVLLLCLALSAINARPAAAQNCCSCDYNGTSCSACCYPDQAPACDIFGFGATAHCGCYCDPVTPDPSPCGRTRLQSRTLALSATVAPAPSDPQLRYGVLRPAERQERSFVLEEWALLSLTRDKITVKSASTASFRGRVQEAAELFRPRGTYPSTLLVVEDAEHPQNSLDIPLPTLGPIDVDAGLPAKAAGQEFWFRAEVGENGLVDELELLNAPESFAAEGLKGQLESGLDVRYADERRHRVVVFAVLRADAKGHLVMAKSLVVLPTCCCGGRRCV